MTLSKRNQEKHLKAIFFSLWRLLVPIEAGTFLKIWDFQFPRVRPLFRTIAAWVVPLRGSRRNRSLSEGDGFQRMTTLKGSLKDS